MEWQRNNTLVRFPTRHSKQLIARECSRVVSGPCVLEGLPDFEFSTIPGFLILKCRWWWSNIDRPRRSTVVIELGRRSPNYVPYQGTPKPENSKYDAAKDDPSHDDLAEGVRAFGEPRQALARRRRSMLWKHRRRKDRVDWEQPCGKGPRCQARRIVGSYDDGQMTALRSLKQAHLCGSSPSHSFLKPGWSSTRSFNQSYFANCLLGSNPYH